MDFCNWLSPGPRFERTGADLADMVVADARIFTSDAARPRASAMAVRGGRIIYVGDDGGAAVHVGQDTRLIDGRKRVLTPGFIDNHCHVCLLYTSDAADDLLCVDIGGRRSIKKKKKLLDNSNYISR